MRGILGSRTGILPTRQIVAWLLRLLNKHKLQVTLNIVLGCLIVVFDFAFIALTKQTIDMATHKAQGSLTLCALLLLLVLIFLISLHYASRWVRAILGVKAQNKLQQHIFVRLLHGDWLERNKHHSGDILNRLERDVRDVTDTVTETAPAFITVLFRLAGAFLFLFTMDRRLACLTVVIIPFFMLLSKLYLKKMRGLTRQVRTSDSLIQSLLQESIQHQTVVQTLEQQDTLRARLDGLQARLRAQIKQRTRFSSASAAVLSTGFSGCYLVAFLWGIIRLHDGTITYGMLTAFIQLVGQIQVPFRDLSRFIPIMVNALTASERLIELESIPIEQAGSPVDTGVMPGIRFSNVTYRYTPQGRAILHNFTYDFPPGSQTAIVGETGAGKTTLTRLMLALIRPSEGTVSLYTPHDLIPCSASTRAHFTYVPQGNTLFSGTIRNNLLLGNPDATDNDMRSALYDACAEFVLSLPQGLDTLCGEQGTGLSEGQAQRIAIARALLRPRSSILLFDEASSALDAITEQRLWTNILSRCKGKTLIFITHRTAVITPHTRVLRLERNIV